MWQMVHQVIWSRKLPLEDQEKWRDQMALPGLRCSIKKRKRAKMGITAIGEERGRERQERAYVIYYIPSGLEQFQEFKSSSCSKQQQLIKKRFKRSEQGNASGKQLRLKWKGSSTCRKGDLVWTVNNQKKRLGDDPLQLEFSLYSPSSAPNQNSHYGTIKHILICFKICIFSGAGW